LSGLDLDRLVRLIALCAFSLAGVVALRLSVFPLAYVLLLSSWHCHRLSCNKSYFGCAPKPSIDHFQVQNAGRLSHFFLTYRMYINIFSVIFPYVIRLVGCCNFTETFLSFMMSQMTQLRMKSIGQTTTFSTLHLTTNVKFVVLRIVGLLRFN